jgi:predicted nucleic acid-binding protein
MEASFQKRLSLDTNVLFDLAEERDFAHDFREAYQQKGYSLLIPRIVLAEIYFFLEHGDSEEERLARGVVRDMAGWDIQAAPLTGIQGRIAKALATKISAFGLLPSEEVNDALILGETAVAGIPVVVTSDSHLLNVDQEKLRSICLDAGVVPVVPASPRRLLAAIR